MASSRLINRNVTALHGRTSMRLEPEMWNALEEICRRESVTLADLVRCIERAGHPGGRTSAVRVHVLNYFRNAATDGGHDRAGHGSPDDNGGGDEAEIGGTAASGATGWQGGQSAATLAG